MSFQNVDTLLYHFFFFLISHKDFIEVKERLSPQPVLQASTKHKGAAKLSTGPQNRFLRAQVARL
jgi:hypothetical protein